MFAHNRSHLRWGGMPVCTGLIALPRQGQNDACHPPAIFAPYRMRYPSRGFFSLSSWVRPIMASTFHLVFMAQGQSSISLLGSATYRLTSDAGVHIGV